MLLFHIGLPKAGSTSLQAILARSIAPRLRIIVGDPLYEQEKDICRRPSHALLRLAFGQASPGVSASELERLRAAAQSTSETLVVSHEGFSVPGRFPPRQRNEPRDRRPFSIETRLRGALRALDADPERTRIVCQIRRPDEWLASAFAWGMFYSRSANSVDLYARTFEAFVDKWLRSPHREEDPLDNTWLDDVLSSVVGRENVNFLPLHTFGTRSYWEAFAAGSTLAPAQLHRISEGDATRHNVRVSGDGTWVPVRPNNVRGWLLDAIPFGGLAYRVIASRWNLPVRGSSLVGPLRPRPFTLQADISGVILDRYGAGNRAFAEARGLDLDGQGYWR
jgi:hypothetical protein